MITIIMLLAILKVINEINELRSLKKVTTWPGLLTARNHGFQPWNEGSIPSRVTIKIFENDASYADRKMYKKSWYRKASG